MGKKKEYTPFYQGKDFMDSTAKKTYELIKDQIDKVINGHLDNLLRVFQQSSSNLAKSQVESTAKVYTRIMAIEKLLMEKLDKVDKEVLKNNIVEVEDEATGYQKANRPAEKGDFIRCRVESKRKDAESFNQSMPLNIHNLGSEPPQNYKEVDEAIMGMKAGETKLVDLKIKQQDKEVDFQFKITVDYISEPTEEKKAEVERKKKAMENIQKGDTTDVSKNA